MAQTATETVVGDEARALQRPAGNHIVDGAAANRHEALFLRAGGHALDDPGAQALTLEGRAHTDADIAGDCVRAYRSTEPEAREASRKLEERDPAVLEPHGNLRRDVDDIRVVSRSGETPHPPHVPNQARHAPVGSEGASRGGARSVA